MTLSLQTMPADARAQDPDLWWRHDAVYQVYMRSFADANGDGIGDLAGVRARLPYLAALGVDALWFNPWYPSPLADAGYDIADYRSIDPAFGTLWEAEQLIAEAASAGSARSSTSSRTTSRASTRGSGRRSPRRRVPRPRALLVPAGHGRERRAAAERLAVDLRRPGLDARAPSGEWYLHLFAPEQPDLNWEHPEVWAEHEDILRFWFDRGVAGVRIDSAALLVKDPAASRRAPETPGSRASIRSPTATSCTRSTALARGRRQLRGGAAGARRRGVAARRRALRALSAPR